MCPTVEAMRAQVSTRYPVANAASVGTSSPPEAARTATIASNAERNRLRALGVLIKPPGAGLLIRTEADGISEDLLIEDLESLLRQWEAIQ